MDFKGLSVELVQTIKKYKHILVPIKGSPDPDAMASAYIFELICQAIGVKATIDSPVLPSLSQNVMIIKELHLPIHFEKLSKEVKSCDAYAVLDHQSVFVEGVSGVIPCAIHIDHHDKLDEDIPVEFKLVEQQAGSTSTLMVFLAEELGKILKLSAEQKIKTATALYYGIKTDTNNFQYAQPLDLRARDMIEPDADLKLIERISSLPFSKEAMVIVNKAIKNQEIHQEWLVSGIGYIEREHRDMMAVTADFLLKRDRIYHVVIFAIVRGAGEYTLEVLFRTKIKKFNLNRLIKKICRKGGGRRFKGAYQVNLDYFRYCKNEALLWKLIYQTTMEALSEQSRTWRAGSRGRLYDLLIKPFSRLLNNQKRQG